MTLSSTWQTEIAITVSDSDNLQKLESTWQPEIYLPINEVVDMTFITRFRFDTQNNIGYQGNRINTDGKFNGASAESYHSDIEIREWYFDAELAGIFWRLGKQQVVWGQADGLKILDVINPQSYREFILDNFDNSRIPLWMINAEIPIGDDDSLQFLWIIDQSYHRFANNDGDYQMTSPLLTPQPAPGIRIARFDVHKPKSTFKDSDLGLRYSKFYQGWDLTFNYLYHYLDTPIFKQQFTGNHISIDGTYKRNHLLGLTATKAFNDWTVRSEIGYSTQSYHLLNNTSQAFIDYNGIYNAKDLSSVIGIDWQGLTDIMLSVQWFQSSLLDFNDDLNADIIRPKHNHILSLLYQQNFANETWTLNILTLYGTDKNDKSIQIELSHMLESNVKIWLAADLFEGDKQSLFGQFNDTDRIVLGFELGF
jgi:hypothetical protein